MATNAARLRIRRKRIIAGSLRQNAKCDFFSFVLRWSSRTCHRGASASGRTSCPGSDALGSRRQRSARTFATETVRLVANVDAPLMPGPLNCRAIVGTVRRPSPRGGSSRAHHEFAERGSFGHQPSYESHPPVSTSFPLAEPPQTPA